MATMSKDVIRMSPDVEFIVELDAKNEDGTPVTLTCKFTDYGGRWIETIQKHRIKSVAVRSTKYKAEPEEFQRWVL
jgi:hypothetical protein